MRKPIKAVLRLGSAQIQTIFGLSNARKTGEKLSSEYRYIIVEEHKPMNHGLAVRDVPSYF